jgi:hypothetical protein
VYLLRHETYVIIFDVLQNASQSLAYIKHCVIRSNNAINMRNVKHILLNINYPIYNLIKHLSMYLISSNFLAYLIHSLFRSMNFTSSIFAINYLILPLQKSSTSLLLFLTVLLFFPGVSTIKC